MSLHGPWSRPLEELPPSAVGLRPVNNMASYFAHSQNSAGIKHDLIDHLKSVAELAGGFADKFGAKDFGYWAGLWHDLGKFHPDFQGVISQNLSPRGFSKRFPRP